MIKLESCKNVLVFTGAVWLVEKKQKKTKLTNVFCNDDNICEYIFSNGNVKN